MTDDPRTVETRRRLIDATIETIRSLGIAKVSARTIAATGGVNQALVFYHFGSVHNLLGEACLTTTAERVGQYADRFDAVSSFAGLADLAVDLHAEERALGNVNVLAQVLAGAQASPELADVTGQALRLWTDRVEEVLTRLIATSPFADVFDAKALAQLVSATFIGLELVGPTDPASGNNEFAAMDRLRKLAELADGLGPIARRAVKSTLKKR